MRVMILGATGGTGRQLVDQALAGGHDVTAFVRSPARLQRSDPRLRAVQGSITDAPALEAALSGQEAVLCALGHTRIFDPSRYLAAAVALVVAGMRARGVRRIVYESAWRAGADPRDQGIVFQWILRPLLLRNIFADHLAVEAALPGSGVEWVIARPGILTDGPLTRVYREQESFARGERVRISRADAAHFMLRQLGDTPHLGKRVGLAY